MVVTLSAELEDLIREKVATGRYRSEADVVAVALKLLEERDRCVALAAAIEEGEADLREGRFVDVANVDELKALFSDLL
ncbi:MAG TPA: type II toxin-antitoxin system ParD family antitoxin [Caulobacteraceae bacterium]|jgi:antitoxin ParD1/3/4